MKVKEESEKSGLKLNIQKTKIMTSGPITSWHIEGEKVETVADFSFLGSKITADDNCSHETKRCLLEKEMATPSSILAWKIPRTEEPGGLQFMGSQKIWYNLVTEHGHIELNHSSVYQNLTQHCKAATP